MKTTRIDIEGPNGTATITRQDCRIIIAGLRIARVVERRDGKAVPIGEAFRLFGRPDNHDANVAVARMLQKYLDGCRGTAGDVAEYVRAIAVFED